MRIDFPYHNVDFFLVEKLKETKQFIYYQVVWYQKKKGSMVRHEHQCDYDKLEPVLIKRLKHCDCSNCCLWGINNDRWCIVKKIVALSMVKEGLMDSIVKEWIK